MPDWTFQTVFRPLLFRLGPRRGRSLALGSMGRLARLPFGKRVIRMMGHMSPDSRLALTRHGITFPSRVGLGCALDSLAVASSALAEFGIGYLEIGPVTGTSEAAKSPVPSEVGRVHFDPAAESVVLRSPQQTLAPRDVRQRLDRNGPFQLPVFAHAAPMSDEDARNIVEVLAPVVDGFIVPLDQLESFTAACDDCGGESTSLFVAVDSLNWQDDSTQSRCKRAVGDQLIAGVVVAAATVDGQRQLGKPGFDDALETVRRVRECLGPQPIVVGSIGVHSPADALDMIEAGADLVQVDTGLAFAGPGLPKRINEALLYRQLASDDHLDTHDAAAELPRRAATESWFWAFLMGMSMLVGGMLALLIATTRVVLPYDELMTGLSREQLLQINDRLLSFMAHDRITLSGTMIAVGMTSVFVHEDLEFMQTTAAELHGSHPQLVPLVAHDRATFGGMLIACGVATLLTALWGFQRGQAWLWCALMLAGTIAYSATLAVHLVVGYHSLKHLLPVYGGLAWLIAGGLASYRYLVASDPLLEEEWKRRLKLSREMG